MRRKFLLMTFLIAIIGFCGTNLSAENTGVAKVGNTEYATIDEAIAAWTNGTTLTLLADVTLSDVVTLKSTEHHTLDLGTHTMTAASGKHAIEITCEGRTSASYAITVNADETNPGGITATGKSCIYYYKSNSTKDRPIIRIYNGVFNGSYSINSKSDGNTNCPQIWIYGGTFNGNVNLTKNMLRVFGGVFNGWINCTGDSSAYREISGGTFKSWQFMTADADNKFWVGTSKANYDVGMYVNDEGYLVVGGDVVTEPNTDSDLGVVHEASTANYGGWSSYLKYSSAKDKGLYYTSVEEALADNNKTNGSVTVYVDELDMTGISYKGTIVVPADHTITITNAPATLVVKDANGNAITPNANGTYTTVEPAGNNFTGYTGTDGIWGEVWGNATTSFVIKVVDANDNVMGTTSLNNIGGIIDGDVNVTWNLKLNAASNTDEYWTMSWTTAPTIDNMPAKVELWVDGVKVSGGDVVLNGPDNLNMIYAAVTDANGKILSYHTSIANAVAAITNTRSNPQGYIALLRNTDEAITLPAGIELKLNGFEANNIVIPVASVNGTSYTDLQDAIVAAAPAGTVEILADVVVDEWIMFSETLNISSGQIITMNINGLTINGNGKTVTIKDIESAGNGNRLFYDATKLNINYWTIKYADGVAGGIGLTSGTINKVTIEGGAGVFPGTGNITISECNFKTSGHCIYFEEERDNLVVTNNTFELPADANVILLRGDVEFTDNIVVSGRTVNVVSGSPVVTDNDFNKVRFKVYNAATATIENNEINVLAFNDDSVVCSTFGVNTLSEEAQAVLDAASFPVAQIGTTKYAKLEDAFKAATSGSVIEILSDVTVDYAWDCRNTGSKFTVPVTINGNDKTIKFTGAIDDKNWNTVFRFEEEATVNNLTVNIEGATTVQRVITAKKSLNVDDLTIVGSSRYGIIFGEGASAEDLAATEIVIKNSALNGTRRAVSDNEGGKDVKSVVIEGNNLTANVYVSASESIVFNNNTTTSEVDLRSYAADNVLSVEAKDNELNEEVKNYIYAKNIDAQEEFTTENPPLKVANKAELNAAIAAAKEGNVITLTADIDYGTDQLKIEKAITLDLGGKTLTTRNAYGGMSIKNNPTIKNGNIVHASNTAAIKVWNATAFEDLVIDVQGKGDANKTIGGIVLQEGSTTCVGSIKNVTIKGEALTNGIETYNCGNATENVIGSMENVVINAVGTAMKISAPCGTATDCSFNGGDTGIELWIKGTYSASLDLVECEVSGGKKSVYIHDEFNSNPVVNTGDLKLTADNATTFESESGAPIALTIAHTEGEIDYTLIDKLIETTVAKVNDVYYTTLQAAINVAQTGDVVKVFEGEYSVPSMKAGITIEGVVEGEGEVLFQGTLSGTLENLTLKNIHIKDANAQRWAYAKGNLVFENVIFEATSVYAIHFDGITEGTNLLYKNCTIIGWAAMGGSPASCKFEGCTIKDNGTYGVIRTYFDATIEECTFDIANVNTTDNYQDGIHAVSGANVIVTDCTNENGDMIDVINVGDTSVVVLDGVEIKNIVKVAKKDENPKYYRTLPEAFAAAGDESNTTVTLLADVDLDGAEWTPVNFNGVFDGQDHTISNLTITGYNSNVGFFGQTNNGEIKNLTINNANVSGRLNVGVVAGTPYTSKYTNIKVTGHVEVNGMAYVGGVGGKNAYANWTDITVDVDETSYVKANSVEDGTAYRTYVGGVIGFNGEGSHTFKNITSNIKVIGSTCDIGGIFGIAHYGNNFENIEHSGSVINETNDAIEALETGLIAGVWHNAKGTSVTFTNTTSTGTISAPNADVTFPNNSLVGAAYNASNETASTSGSLVINGETVYPYVAKIGEVGYNTLAKAVTAAQDGETIKLLWAEGDAPISMNASLYGKNVTIKGTATVDWSKGNLFVGRGGEGNAKLTFESANLTSASNSSSYGIHVSGREKNTNNKYDGTLVINNSTIDLDYLINKGTMTLDESTLTVKNGFSIGGRPASETESGEDATATITLNNNSRVVVNNHNGMGLGYEAIGIMNINSGSTFECTQSFLVTAKGTMNVNGGNVKVDGTLTNNAEDAINVNEGESTLNITTLTGESINLNEGAIVKNSTVGGAAYVAGNVLFRGDNTFAMITDYGDHYSSTTPSMWTVEAGASLTLTKTDRYGLGYGDKVTVYGEIENALTARESLTDADASVNMYGGLVGMTNSASPDANNVFKAEDAYLIFGVNGDKSFGNKSGDYYGNYDIDFTNCVVTANGFKFYEDKGNSDVYFNKSDLLVNGVLMTNDASSKFKFENSVVLSKATSNGTDDKNQNAGVLTLVNTTMTYSAAFTNVGNLNIGENSTFTAPEVVNNGTINFTAPSAKLVAQEGLAINLALDNPEYYEIEYADRTYSVKQVIFEQTQTLSSGWNWFSSYINLNSNEGLETLQNALGKNGIEIKSHNSGYVRYDNTYEFWWGSLSAVAADQMYMIRTSTQVDDMKFVGEMVDYNNVSITLKPGWNWIGFPMSEAVSVTDALAGFEAKPGDQIKSKVSGNASYDADMWYGGLNTLVPGEGYMYYNSSSEAKTFTYNVSRSNAELKANVTTDGNHWTPNAGQYPNNMTMTAMVEVEGGDYEVAAFVNGECRGSARPIYIEAMDAHILFLTIHGEDVEEMTFKFYDLATGEEFDLNDRMNYSNDAIVGTIAEPYIFSRGTTGIGEASLSEVNIYPNPTTTGTEINLQATCDTVEVFNALGVKVAEYHNVDSLDAFETAGIYVIRLTNNGDVKHCRLIVK